MPLHWRKLPLPPQENLPPLLFRYITSLNSYEIYLTDLTYIWSERLNHRGILGRASDESTSIDPSEDAEQFKVLLEKIEDALRGSPGSSITLTSGTRSNSLELTTTTKLPSPLPPLQWTFYLSREPQNSLTAELLLPLLKEEADREARQRSLLDHLKEKDWVLRKLFDKIESSGIDLSSVFPGAAGLRTAKKGGSITLSQAAKYIKGLAPFDEQAWLNEFGGDNAESGLVPNLVGELSNAALDLRSLGPAPEKWWESLSIRGLGPELGREKKAIATRIMKLSSTETRKDDVTEDKESEEDEFQRQETPPRIREARRRQQLERSGSIPPEKGRREETPTPSPSPPPQLPKPKPKPGGLGTIGGRKTAPRREDRPPSRVSSTASDISEPPKRAPPPTVPTDQETESDEAEPPPPRPSPVSVSKPKQTAEPPAKDQETESEAAEEKEPEPSRRQPSPDQIPKPKQTTAEEPPAKKRGLLGVIGGGKKKAKEPSPAPLPISPDKAEKIPTTTTTTPSPSPQKPKPKRPGGKLGVIGGVPKPSKDKQDLLPSRAPPPTAAPAAESTASEAEDDDLDPVSPAAKKKSKASPSPPRKAQAQQPIEPEPEPKREETAQEKADRKRQELKRQLEAKRQAPTKKKRKF